MSGKCQSVIYSTKWFNKATWCPGSTDINNTCKQSLNSLERQVKSYINLNYSIGHKYVWEGGGGREKNE
jgi:hypothetical protein